MIALALSLSLLIGVSLGLLGGGGATLTVPILTYVAGLPPKAAIASSLFVVGITSLTGVLTHARAGRVRWRTGLVLGSAGMVGAFGGGYLAGHLPARVLMLLFAAMLIATGLAMLIRRPVIAPSPDVEPPVARVLAQGLAIGLIAGTVGAGGGFLVVPTLVLLGGLPMTAAVGTSLLVITMQSAAGFAGHLGHVTLDWQLTLGVTAAAVAGSFVGGALAGRIAAGRLRTAFGVLVLVMAALILVEELLLHAP